MIEARTAMGWARDHDDPDAPAQQSQRVVCFSETPLEHINLMLGPMEPSRSIVMEPYGVALTKLKARKLGINPVWYVDQTPGRDWVLRNALNDLRDSTHRVSLEQQQPFHAYAAARVFPFVEQMGTWPSNGTRKEFWWEREWRHVGPLTLPAANVIWLCKADEHPQLEALAGRQLRPWIDPRWGLEAIIAHFAGFEPQEVSPFAEREPQLLADLSPTLSKARF
ncbi:MAG: abortive infection system antitoxin AbiGi family protein [Gaiellaceae bacterium]